MQAFWKFRQAFSSMQTLRAEEFPDINLEIGENSFVMNQGALKKVIAETVFCCAQDDARPVLKGCLTANNFPGTQVSPLSKISAFTDF